MMRISREEEHYIGPRPDRHDRPRPRGIPADGRITALDLFIVKDNGPYGPMGDYRSAANAASLIWQPLAMRWRGVAVITNTPPRSQQRSPGAMQANAIMEPVVTRRRASSAWIKSRFAASTHRKQAPYGRRRGRTGRVRHHERVREAGARSGRRRVVQVGRAQARAGKRQGSKVRGIGVAVGAARIGSIGYDGLMTIQPDGKLYVQSGVGNLGTHSLIDLARVAADVLAMPWRKVVVNWGNTSRNLAVELACRRQSDDARDGRGRIWRRDRTPG